MLSKIALWLFYWFAGSIILCAVLIGAMFWSYKKWEKEMEGYGD